MTFSQEDALYDFLDNATDPFNLAAITSFIRGIDSSRAFRLAGEVKEFIELRSLAFSLGNRRWISRRGFFEGIPFVICPSRLELLNGILVPGHRCVPFANPALLPQEYAFEWKGSQVPVSATEGEPGEFYPFYAIYGEEYAPQYVARDNPENETAFNSDPYEDPPEVSVGTLDMRSVYRETSFVPGDRFVARTVDWKKGIFSLERVEAGAWSAADLYPWFEAAENGFEDSFNQLGPGSATEEQIAFAYWHGGKRMRELPAYSLEEFLYEKTERIETVPYGIETRFWYAGREIPDLKGLKPVQDRPDKTDIEEFLHKKKVPVSEWVIHSYVLDYFYRKDTNISLLSERIIPPAVKMSHGERVFFEAYLTVELEETDYSLFTDNADAPIRQRVGELHTAVIELAAQLEKERVDPSWLPRQVFIILSQLQGHAAGVMEDLDPEEKPSKEELEAIDNSLDSMIETYEDIRGSIDEALENFRRNRFSLVKTASGEPEEWLIQLGIGGTGVWRRVILPGGYDLEGLHRIIQNVFGWTGAQIYQFRGEEVLDNRITVKDLGDRGLMELRYEYGTKWTITVMLLTKNTAKDEEPVRCVAGDKAAPPENIGGPLRFRRFVSALSQSNNPERPGAERELGGDFRPDVFDVEACNQNLRSDVKISGLAANRREGK